MKWPFVWILLLSIIAYYLFECIGLLRLIVGLFVAAIINSCASRLKFRSPVSLAPVLFFLSGVLLLLCASSASFRVEKSVSISALVEWSNYSVYGNHVPVEIEARLRSITRRATSATIVLDEVMVVNRGSTFRVRGRLRIQEWAGAGISKWNVATISDRFRLRGTLVPLEEPRNPADFDEKSYLMSVGIFAGFLLESHPVRLAHIDVIGFSEAILTFRDFVVQHLRRSLHSDAARALVPAMLIGDRQFLGSALRKQFRTSGLSHLLAISGLHVGILGYSVFWLLGSLLRRTPISIGLQHVMRATITLTILIGFVLLTGSSASVVRAAIMGSVLVIASVTARRRDTVNVLAFTAFLMFSYNPGVIATAGFQLSFSAVAAIVLFNSEPPFVLNIKHAFYRRILSLLLVSTYIFAVTLPIVLFHFGEVAAGGILLNVLAIPTASAFMMSALISTIWSLAAMPFSAELLYATDFIADVLVLIGRVGSGLFENVMVTSPAGHIRPIYFVPLLMVFPGWKKKRSSHRKNLRIMTPVAVGILVLLIWTSMRRDLGRISVLNIGQGDATLIVSRNGRCTAIDTGPGYSSYQSLRKELLSSGCRRLLSVILTHDHADHTGGLRFLIEAGLVRSISGPPSILTSEKSLSRPWHVAAREQSIPVKTLAAGDHFFLDETSRLLILSPGAGHNETSFAESENTSVVAMLVAPDLKVLFMGDAEWKQEKTLVLKYGRLLRSSIVKVGHHGSKTSSSASFVVRTTIPDSTVAVFSYGLSNRFGHPSPIVVHRWKLRKSVIHEHGYFRVLEQE